jgi:hypothetical protein
VRTSSCVSCRTLAGEVVRPGTIISVARLDNPPEATAAVMAGRARVV